MNIKFRIEGQADVERKITVGENLSLDQVPVFTVEEGEEFDWEFIPAVADKILGMGEVPEVDYISEESLSNVLFDQTYQVTFDTKGAVISVLDRTDNNLPRLLAVGSFSKNTVLEMQDILASEARVNGEMVIANYIVNISNPGVKKLHFLVPEGVEAKEVKLFVKDSFGNWTERTFVIEGKYIIFDFGTDDIGFALSEDVAGVFGKLVVFVGIFVIISIIISLGLRKRNKSKKNN